MSRWTVGFSRDIIQWLVPLGKISTNKPILNDSVQAIALAPARDSNHWSIWIINLISKTFKFKGGCVAFFEDSANLAFFMKRHFRNCRIVTYETCHNHLQELIGDQFLGL